MRLNSLDDRVLSSHFLFKSIASSRLLSTDNIKLCHSFTVYGWKIANNVLWWEIHDLLCQIHDIFSSLSLLRTGIGAELLPLFDKIMCRSATFSSTTLVFKSNGVDKSIG